MTTDIDIHFIVNWDLLASSCHFIFQFIKKDVLISRPLGLFLQPKSPKGSQMCELMNPTAEWREGSRSRFKGTLTFAVVWIWGSPRGSYIKGLVPRVLPGDSATYKGWSLMAALQVIEACPWRGLRGSCSSSFPCWVIHMLPALIRCISTGQSNESAQS